MYLCTGDAARQARLLRKHILTQRRNRKASLDHARRHTIGLNKIDFRSMDPRYSARHARLLRTHILAERKKQVASTITQSSDGATRISRPSSEHVRRATTRSNLSGFTMRDPRENGKQARLLRKHIIAQRKRRPVTISNSATRTMTRDSVVDDPCSSTSIPSIPSKGKKRSRQIDNEQFDIPMALPTNGEHTRKYTQPWSFGGPTGRCSDCEAIVWFEERARKDRNSKSPKYSICCQKGKVKLPLLKDPPEFLKELLNCNDPRSKQFKDRGRVYNSINAFTSMGGKVDNTINRGNAPYVFRLNGQNHHKIGSLLPPEGKQPRFSQLYIYDTENEVESRIHSIGNGESTPDLDPEIVAGLSKMFDKHNQLAKVFRMARERFAETDLQPVKIRLIGTRAKDGRQYNLPSASEIAALIIRTGDAEKGPRDVIIEDKHFGLKRISELDPSFMAMQYPLLFPYGEDGYTTDIPHNDVDATGRRVRTTVTMREYYAFRFQQREREAKTRFQLGRLNQQQQVDAFTCVQESRLEWVRGNQKKIRKDVLRGLADAVSRGDTEPASIGQRVVLPQSFSGCLRFNVQNYHDALAICRWAGPPDLFITMTCNPKWPEVKDFLSLIPGQKPEDRPDIIARLLKIKLDELIDDLTKKISVGGQKQVNKK
ncbi:uncharacterized protein LOC110709442 [Chenopodium quinoa]|uniref:uncharacterized protein LOC110709442 n=1 Tax=Chenopodium quinoa TaxID=63459 RepID=UPI000B778DCE|nr:uncharacterized protein LOC110709442 [Chenopodium quinoa]